MSFGGASIPASTQKCLNHEQPEDQEIILPAKLPATPIYGIVPAVVQDDGGEQPRPNGSGLGVREIRQVMKMSREEYEALSKDLQADGYQRASTRSMLCDHYWYKMFRKERGFKGFQVLLKVYDSATYQERYPGLPDISMAMEMSMNHETPMDIDRCDFMLMKEGMGWREFEHYCWEVHDAMLKILPPKKEPEKTNEP